MLRSWDDHQDFTEWQKSERIKQAMSDMVSVMYLGHGSHSLIEDERYKTKGSRPEIFNYKINAGTKLVKF